MKTPETRNELADMIEALVAKGDDEWENKSAFDFLNATAAWLRDANGYYQDIESSLDPNLPSWRLFADAIRAGVIYE